MQTRLRPPLATVQSRLCGPSDALLDRFLHDPLSLSPQLRAAISADEAAQSRPQEGEQDRNDDVSRELVPEPGRSPTLAQMAELHSLLDRREATRSLQGTLAPAPGQLRLVEQIVGPRGAAEYDLPTPLTVVLGEPVPDEPGVWYGWMASPDPDYASPWDLILEADVADPLAAVVQCWNSVLIYLESTTRLIGQLSEHRLEAVKALAYDYAFGEDPEPRLSSPGSRVTREVDGHIVLTGTPLGEASTDPRLDYQLLYHEAAEPLRVCAREALGQVAEPDEAAATVASPVDLASWIRDAIGAIVERFRESAAATGLAFRELALIPTPASTEVAGPGRRIALADLLSISLHGQQVEDFLTLHARIERLGATPVSLEVLHDGVLIATETLSDARPFLDVPLSGARRAVVRITAPVALEVHLPNLDA